MTVEWLLLLLLLQLHLQLVTNPKGEGEIVLHHGVGLALTLVPFQSSRYFCFGLLPGPFYLFCSLISSLFTCYPDY